MYLNKVMLYGNLTRDPELKSLPSGIQVTNFSIATNRVYKDRDGNKQEQAEFHNIVVFGRQAETVSQYLKKGSAAYVEGRLQTRSWEQDGQKKYRTEIIAERVQFGPRSTGGGAPVQADDNVQNTNSDSADSGGIDYPQDEINPDDIPF
ncbi:single-stranded DNA-binding protein [Candidatus Kaiserbacteria bacterium CG10_big_fil_rev_8_21_14_0_10_43_70]|uniref:Single-stranded DNA-binding protein n=1 Tax=Candidatus Kaiserbacteria bacterium CG10_big_fil_rev_8_21_14_0_10_43_70 TaxID=1974605 RepID=A0A2H0UIS7_9BACT|nr:MAG: single-stranded DNA-binding protein [Candidatus Kaiserbacteria bacterium CG10_big_fil_rev_8_21_14_0_10_43_70]